MGASLLGLLNGQYHLTERLEPEQYNSLKGEAKIAKRDKHRWELDPASSEDFKER